MPNRTTSVTNEMKRVSVIIPSYCRPLLLREAVQSLAGQTYPAWQVIVIDDGSTPPVDLAALRAVAKREVTLLRNTSPLGQAVSRERGESAATGDYILHLDDDDRLAPEALACGMKVFEVDPEVDIVFFNVQGFGERADGFEQSQKAALESVLRTAEGTLGPTGIIRFGRKLFPALLASVPMAFQRPMAKRNAWREVTELRRRAYGDEHPLSPPLREAEWSLYAAATKRIGLMTDPLYLQRCNSQGYFSAESKREAAGRASVEISEHMLRFSGVATELMDLRNEIRQAAEKCYFDRAYALFYAGERIAAIEFLLKAMALHFRFTYLRFGFRMLLPRGKRKAGRTRP